MATVPTLTFTEDSGDEITVVVDEISAVDEKTNGKGRITMKNGKIYRISAATLATVQTALDDYQTIKGLVQDDDIMHRQVAVKTANHTAETSEVGKTFTNEGAAGAVTITLPPATVGLHYYGYVMEAQELRFDPDGTETIALPSTGAQGAAGKYLTANAEGEWVHLLCVKAGEWGVCGYAGTWTAEA